MGIPIIDADILAREVVAPPSPLLGQLKSEFGPEILNPDGTLARKALGAIVFKDASKRRLLEGIVHPKIREAYLQRLGELQKSTLAPFILYVVPLLFESNFSYQELAGTIVVSSPQEVALRRIVDRDRCTKEEALDRIHSQLPIEVKEGKANYIIHNESDRESLKARVEELFRKIVSKNE